MKTIVIILLALTAVLRAEFVTLDAKLAKGKHDVTVRVAEAAYHRKVLAAAAEYKQRQLAAKVLYAVELKRTKDNLRSSKLTVDTLAKEVRAIDEAVANITVEVMNLRKPPSKSVVKLPADALPGSEKVVGTWVHPASANQFVFKADGTALHYLENGTTLVALGLAHGKWKLRSDGRLRVTWSGGAHSSWQFEGGKLLAIKGTDRQRQGLVRKSEWKGKQ